MKLSILTAALFALMAGCSSAYANYVYYQGTISNIQAGWFGEGYAFQLNAAASTTYGSVIQGGSCAAAIGTNAYAIPASQSLFYPLLKQLFYAYARGQIITVVVDNTQCAIGARGYVVSIFNP